MINLPKRSIPLVEDSTRRSCSSRIPGMVNGDPLTLILNSPMETVRYGVWSGWFGILGAAQVYPGVPHPCSKQAIGRSAPSPRTIWTPVRWCPRVGVSLARRCPRAGPFRRFLENAHISPGLFAFPVKTAKSSCMCASQTGGIRARARILITTFRQKPRCSRPLLRTIY